MAKAQYDSQADIDAYLEQVNGIIHKPCPNNAPFICYKNSAGAWNIVQASCNSWLCPRCGLLRAKEEYGRMVGGTKQLDDAGHNLYFHTYTCRGAELSLQEADDNYLVWTNRLLTTLRKDALKRAEYWCYVQVTERQKRGHAHSHVISTYVPSDAIEVKQGGEVPPVYVGTTLIRSARIATHDLLHSPYFVKRNRDAGLGVECDLSQIRNPVAVAVYAAKYLFKDAQITEFAKGWRRIRYSRNFPKMPEISGKEAFAVVKRQDWRKIANLGCSVRSKDYWIVERAYAYLVTNVEYVPD